MTRINVASVRFATALAHSVFPVPGGPYNMTPLGGSIPNLTNRSGWMVSNGSWMGCLQRVMALLLLHAVVLSVPYILQHPNM